ncbi:uncharacterized protein LOC123654546 [Melitaea cinxia]|uniref:uncharacterized protein LOC123654546 n=1 Tax=Melitaea cinxia TaxID=113334 RepID=UPI001E2709CA|nr:uncharacterized protein LOC123654546 [Melitaea cinxia]
MNNSLNSPFVIWTTCFFWLISIFGIFWSIILFFWVGDMIFSTGTDLVNAVVLLSAIVMLPPNFYSLHAIANGKKIEYNAKVFCCRLWTCILWIVIINIIGIILCVQRMYLCQEITKKYISNSMKQYRIAPKHRQFIDKLQWSLGCCGLKSYKDWFSQDWHDKVRDYEWASPNVRDVNAMKQVIEIDSVSMFISCCKSGSCVSSYLKELGNYSINTNGCGNLLYRFIMVSMTVHLIMFLIIIILEIFFLKSIITKNDELDSKNRSNKLNIRHIMSVNDNFEMSSGSYNLNEEDSEIDPSNVYYDEK